MIKRLLCALLTVLLLFSFASCGKARDDGKFTIVCTLFPQYDWLRNVTHGAENVEIVLLISNGTDPHSYQPTASDIMTISNCDMIVYTGADSDQWVQKAIERSKNQDITKIKLTELDGIELQNISDSSHSHDHEHDEHDDHEGHSHSALDEHLYLSLHNAKAATLALKDELCKIDSSNAELYSKNATAYAKELDALDSAFRDDLAASGIEEPFMLFADRFPFVYLLSDLGISYSAAFEGCSADVDAGFDTVIRLIKEVDAHNAKFVAVTETSDKALARTVISSTKTKDQKIITLNAMQAVTSSQIDNGMTYLSVMKDNLNAVRLALGITN